MINCVICNEQQEHDICFECQADGKDHPLPKAALLELERRQGIIRVTTKCPFCSSTHDVRVDQTGWLKRQDGALIQDALPELSVDDRERLISGICPECFP